MGAGYGAVASQKLVGPRTAAAQDAARPLTAAQRGDPRPAALSTSGRAAVPLIVEPLTEREQEVLRHVAHMLSTAEVAGAILGAVQPQDRCTLVAASAPRTPVFHEVERLPGSARGDGGFGSTGGHAAAGRPVG